MTKTELNSHIEWFLNKHENHIKSDNWIIVKQDFSMLSFKGTKLFNSDVISYVVIFFKSDIETKNNMLKSGFLLNGNRNILDFDINIYNSNIDYWLAKELNIL